RIKPLGVPASQPGLVSAAARRIRAYVEGAAAPQPSVDRPTQRAAYYASESATAPGRGFGALRESVTIGSQIDGDQLLRILDGRLLEEADRRTRREPPTPAPRASEAEWIPMAVCAET